MMEAWVITIPLAVTVAFAGYFITAFALTLSIESTYFAIFLRSTVDYHWVCYGSS